MAIPPEGPRQHRPDLFAKLDLSSKLDQKLLQELDEEEKHTKQP